VIEFVADKIPWVDSVWDAVHTVIRPAIGATVAALIAGQSGSLPQIVAATTGGLTALASHSVKAGIRAAVNTSPEPASNIAVSAAEDVTVAGVVSLSVLHPVAAAVIAGVLLVAGATLVVLLLQRIRRFRERWRQRRAARPAT
jgi:isopentenyl diphosphate isomerase/L-lactate dehydrogenase-like FMN-dependent dehydrogenase